MSDSVSVIADNTPSGDGAAPVLATPSATSPRPAPEGYAEDHPYLFFNRELSWLDFNWRVLRQAMDERVPLMERVHFLSIASSNLDEFFRKRVGGLKRQEAAGVRALSPDGRTASEQLALIRKAVPPMYATMTSLWEASLRPQLAESANIRILSYDDLSSRQKDRLHRYFKAHIFPILTPLAVDPGHPFPFISNLSLSLAISLRHPRLGTEHFARLKVPTSRGRWVPLEEPNYFVPLEQVIQHNLNELLRGMEIEHAHAFQITRNADISRNEEEADDLIEMMSDELRERRFAPVVRLEVEQDMPPRIRRLLMRELTLSSDDVYVSKGLLDHSDCAFFARLDGADFKYPPFHSVTPPRLQAKGEPENAPDIFSIIRKGDVLVHHPYESFRASVQRFVEEAAEDPCVLAIKQTLYRTSEKSPIVDALIRAAERGKQVAVLVEVKARFDEANNMEWGRQLENAGVHVTYGLMGLKTHAKVTLVVREEDEALRAYCHIGTGNYNPATARFYTDMGLLTCREDIGYDIINLFHFLTGYAPEQHYKKLLVAPRDLREAFSELVEQEIAHHKEHGDGRIIAKMNALDDTGVIRNLYKASRAGVKIDLIVRGHNRLRPNLPGYSENIRVCSVVGRFLEHSRIFCFHNAGHPLVYLGSADWQRRNLEDRVEVIVPVEEPALRQRCLDIMQLYFEDRRLAWDLDSDGQYTQRQPASRDEEEGVQEQLIRWMRQAGQDAA